MSAGDKYTKSDAKAWAQENFVGACNIIIPSFTNDLRGLNESGIRHDVRRNVELGFWGALLVSEAGTTAAEMREFMEIAVDEAAGRQYFVLHGSFDTLDDTIKMAKSARSIGVDALLMAYPNSFHPSSVEELSAYTRAVCDGSDLGVILFSVPHFNFARFDPSGFPLQVWDELVGIENVVALKYEVGQPGIVGAWEFFERFKDKNVLICDPHEPNMIVWAEVYKTPWVGTSNYEYYGNSIPTILDHLNQGRRAEALDLYWKLQPARQVRTSLNGQMEGANFLHRYLSKYQAWLQGYNGGPLRAPAMKLTDAQMFRVADGLVRSGLIDKVPNDFGDFFIGRNAR